MNRKDALKTIAAPLAGLTGYWLIPAGGSVSRTDGTLPGKNRMWCCMYCRTPKGPVKKEDSAGMLITVNADEGCSVCGCQTFCSVGKA